MNITLDLKNARRSPAQGTADIAIPIITEDEAKFARVISDITNDYCISPQNVTEHYVFACECNIRTIEVYISINPYLDLIFIDRFNGTIDDYKHIKKIISDYFNSGENKNVSLILK